MCKQIVPSLPNPLHISKRVDATRAREIHIKRAENIHTLGSGVSDVSDE
jgi:hypothetical protein